MPPQVVVVDGLIGVGKTTVLRNLEERGYPVIYEPVDRWANLLKLFYEDQARWCLTLQMQILLDLTERLEEQLSAPASRVVFVERSADSAEVFVRKAVQSGNLTPGESRLYRRYAQRLRRRRCQTVVYLTAPTATCLARIRRRGRGGEQHIDAEYLTGIRHLYEAVVVPKCAVVLDAATALPNALANQILAALKIERRTSGGDEIMNSSPRPPSSM